MVRIAILFLVPVLAAACGRAADSPSSSSEPADTRVRELADADVSGYLDQFPEQATYYGVPQRRHDKLTDNR